MRPASVHVWTPNNSRSSRPTNSPRNKFDVSRKRTGQADRCCSVESLPCSLLQLRLQFAMEPRNCRNAFRRQPTLLHQVAL